MNADEVRPGLRDRKRAQTRARIETAAIELVLRDGLDSATIDAISERADVSPRTFFNYFESKDAAILGLQPHEIDEEALSEQLASGRRLDPIAAVVSLVTSTMGVAAQGNTQNAPQPCRDHAPAPRDPEQPVRPAQRAPDPLGRACRPDPVPAPPVPGRPRRFARANIVLAVCVSATRSAVEDWAQTTDIDHVRETDADEADGHRAARGRARLQHLGKACVNKTREPARTERLVTEADGAGTTTPGTAQEGGRQRGVLLVFARPDGRDAAGIAGPDDLQHRPAHDRGRPPRREPHAVGHHGLHAGLDHHDAGLRQGRRPDRPQEPLHRRDRPVHGGLGHRRPRRQHDLLIIGRAVQGWAAVV